MPINALEEKNREKVNNNGLLKLLDDHQIQVLVLDLMDDQHFIDLFRGQPAWSVDCEDETIIIFTRTNPLLSND